MAVGSRRPLPRRDNHLAIRGGDTTGRIKPRHRRPHAMIDFNLPFLIDPRPELLRQLCVENITAGRENIIDLDSLIAVEPEGENLAITMFDVAGFLALDGNLIFLQPFGVARAPADFLPISHDDHTHGIVQHAELLDGLVVAAADRDPLLADTVTVAVFAKKHAMSEAFLNARNVGRQVENSRRQKQAMAR